MPLRRLSSWLAPGRAGFAGIPGLARPRDWHVLARDAVAQCEALVDEVVRSPPSAAVVRLLDNISDTVGGALRWLLPIGNPDVVHFSLVLQQHVPAVCAILAACSCARFWMLQSSAAMST